MFDISVVIPVYNREKQLNILSHALKCQLNDRVEVIFVDDGSCDLSRKIILDEFNNCPNVKLISIPHSGAGAARNRGISYANGKYIWFVDSDDLILPGAFSTLFSIIDKDNGKTDLFVFDYQVRIGEETLKKELFSENELSFNKNEAIESFFSGSFANSVWNKLFKSEIIKNNNCTFPEELTNGEDGIFVLRYMEHIKSLKYLEESIYIYIKNENSLTTLLKPEIFKNNLTVYNYKKEYILKYVFKKDQKDLEYKRRLGESTLKNIIKIVNSSNRKEDIISSYRYIMNCDPLKEAISKTDFSLRFELKLIKLLFNFKNPELLYSIVKIMIRLRNQS